MSLGFDWNGDGKDTAFDDLVTLHVLDKSQKNKGGSGKNSGGCGTCAVAVLAIPVTVLGVVLKAKGIL